MKKKLFYMMLLSGLGFAISALWACCELYYLFKYDLEFDFKTVPTLFTFAIVYQILGVAYDKTNLTRRVSPKPKRKIIPLDYPGWGVPEDSQTPVKL
jgi:hypothetical protein